MSRKKIKPRLSIENRRRRDRMNFFKYIAHQIYVEFVLFYIFTDRKVLYYDAGNLIFSPLKTVCRFYIIYFIVVYIKCNNTHIPLSHYNNDVPHLNDNRRANISKRYRRFLNNRFSISVLHYERRDLRQLLLLRSQ